MKLPTITRILVEDMPSAVQDWIGKIAEPLNNFMRTLKTGLDKDVTVNDNLSGAIKTVRIPANNPLTIKFVYTSKRPPKVVLVGNWVDRTGTTTLTTGVYAEWSFDGRNVITIHSVTGLTVTHTYDVTFLILDD